MPDLYKLNYVSYPKGKTFKNMYLKFIKSHNHFVIQGTSFKQSIDNWCRMSENFILVFCKLQEPLKATALYLQSCHHYMQKFCQEALLSSLPLYKFEGFLHFSSEEHAGQPEFETTTLKIWLIQMQSRSNIECATSIMII